MKVLFLDIETSPNVAHVWGLWKQNVGLNQILETGFVMCWAAKWAGAPKEEMMYSSQHIDTRRAMIRKIHALLDEADIVVHYNGKKFDIPTLNVEFVKQGLLPPATYKQLDLLETVKSNFRFPSNKLEHICKEFKIGAKVKHEGHELWIKCLNGDDDAWNKMESYNKHDVELVEELYYLMLPWSKAVLNAGLQVESRDDLHCPTCGGTNLHKRGFAYTNVSKFQRYQCNDCGTWCRGRSNLHDRANITISI